MKSLYKFILIPLFIVFSSNFLHSQDSITLDKSALRDIVKFLASDELKGRFPGTDGMEQAAKFVETKFKASGLKPFNNSYRQSFDVTTSYSAGDNNIVTFETIVQRIGVPKERWPRMKQSWELSHDFSPLAFSDNGKVNGEVAFVGFGISAPELKYDDYEGIDVKGKIVILMSESPDGEKKDGEFSRYTDLRYKATNARNKGALGLIMIKIQGDSMNVFERLDYSNVGGNSGIVAIQAQRQSLTKFFPKNRILIQIEDSIIKYKKPGSFILPNVTVEISADLSENKSQTYNICGYVEGTDPLLKGEYIVIGAHYDHLGMGGPTSRYTGKKPMIHNGADDNASGVAAMLEFADYFAKNPTKRPLIFCAFSGEEMGLLGSSYFVRNLPVNKDQIIAMLNFDMIGRLKDELTIFGFSSATIFESIADSLTTFTGQKIIKASDAYGPSDHSSFYAEKIPVLMIFTGVHEDYHKPSDDWDKINYDGMIKVIDFSSKIIKSIADNDNKPVYVESSKTERPANRDAAYSNVWFGIIPGFEESPVGCKINGASPGSPAEKAGLIQHDIITKINGSPIKNLYDFMYKIREFKAGDTVDVTIVRDEKEIEVKVTLVAKIRK